MKFSSTFLFLSLSLMQLASAEIITDKTETLNDVMMETGKDNSLRQYQAKISRKIPHPLNSVQNSVVNFTEKCNNDYKDKREFSDKNRDCKYFNENLIETFVEKSLKTEGWTKEKNEVERYLLGRKVYNRGEFGYYELVKVFHSVNEKNQKVITITQQMLNDKEVKVYTSPKIKKDSAFEASRSVFTLTELGPKETELNYLYEAKTEHWILNKMVSVPQVFASMSKSINDFVKTVEAESTIQTRELASQ